MVDGAAQFFERWRGDSCSRTTGTVGTSGITSMIAGADAICMVNGFLTNDG
jgi:hypothetical protein